MEFIWTLNLLLFFAGISFQVAAVLLLLGSGEGPPPLARPAALLVMIGISSQIAALVTPQVTISSYWFVLGATPLLLPAPLLRRALRRAASPSQAHVEAQPRQAPKAGIGSDAAQAEYREYLRRIPEVLAAHPQGLTLVEIGDALGVEWRRLTGAAKELTERGELHKRGKRYLALRDSEGEGNRPW